MTAAASSVRFLVFCADGEQRHAGTFPTRRDADQWSQWGHVCLADHTVVEVDTKARRDDRTPAGAAADRRAS